MLVYEGVCKGLHTYVKGAMFVQAPSLSIRPTPRVGGSISGVAQEEPRSSGWWGRWFPVGPGGEIVGTGGKQPGRKRGYA